MSQLTAKKSSQLTVSAPRETGIATGIDNLLSNCMELAAGDTLLIVMEDPRIGYFDGDLAQLVSDEAEGRGANVHRLISPRIDAPEHSSALIKEAMKTADHTLFLARIGDQMRFYPLPGEGSKIMCYALDKMMLGSDACSIPYGLMTETLAEVQADIDKKTAWRITCPRGSDISGTYDPTVYSNQASLDFSLKLFPVGPFRPLTCANAEGKLVTSILPASATHLYDPFGITLDEPVVLVVEEGRIVDFEGKKEIVEKVRQHYVHVGETLGIDPFVVHSWHCGTNPKIIYPESAYLNIERWNGVVHSHPRYTHFHTCGNYGPGEIAVSIIDPTIQFDGEEYWRDGVLVLLEQERFNQIAERYGCPNSVFAMNPEIGL